MALPLHRPLCRRARAGALATLLLAIGSAAVAQVHRLDDSASPRSRVQARPDEGADAGASAAASPYITVRFDGIEYRLATAPFVGRRARIFYVVPPFIPGLRSPAGMRVEWRTGGLFAPGTAGPGERRLVWSGTVPGPWMSERFDLRVQFDRRELRPVPGGALDYESYFEMEVLP
ncbi:hypothetical protein ACFPPF_18000 [Xenophilus aerolatus]|nr:hypothetical protein [Xenophilus aerolatus]